MDPEQGAPQGAPPGLMQMILTMLAGAGFKNVSKGMSDMAQTGSASQLFGLPNMPMFLAGAGLKDSANSMELVKPLMSMMMPPPPPKEEVKPQETAAAMQMLSAKLGPGMQGIAPPPGNFPMQR